MRVISKSSLRAFWDKHPQAKTPLTVWYVAVSKAEWQNSQDVKRMFGANVDFVSDNRAIFDISGNKFRLIVYISYPYRRVLIKFIGTHADYDRIDPESV